MSAMTLDDRSADGESDAHPLRLRGEERVEHALGLVWLDAYPRIAHTQTDPVVVAARRANHDLTGTVLDLSHGFERIAKEVDHHLLQLDAVSHYLWQSLRQLEAHRRTTTLNLESQERDHFRRGSVQVH